MSRRGEDDGIGGGPSVVQVVPFGEFGTRAVHVGRENDLPPPLMVNVEDRTMHFR